MNTVFQCELIKKLAAQITIPKYGFYTEKIFKNGTRVGFKAVSLDSRREVVLAHVDFRSLHKVGKYKVNIKDFDSFLSEALKAFLLREKAIVIIDKVGKMELFSGKFRGLILNILGSTETAIITTRTDLAEGWISKIKDKNCHHFELNRGNSEDVFGQILKLIQP
ncbi:AAA family ATPase [bacterium]|nr:AAA family ATPase [bacterium]